MTGEGCVWVTYCGGFKCLQLGVFFIPCHKHLHAGFDATSESDCSQRRSAVSCWFIYEGFLGKHWCLPQVPLYWEWPLQLLACLAPVSLSILSTRWRQRRVAQPRVWALLPGRKQVHIIITISANCGDGSVTVSFDMLHIASITANCCSRPCRRKILKIPCVWSCGLLWNWKWMVIRYNDDHRGAKVLCHRLFDYVNLST